MEIGREGGEDEMVAMVTRRRRHGSHLMLTSSRKPLLRTVVRLILYLQGMETRGWGQYHGPRGQHYLSTGTPDSYLPKKSSLSKSLSKTSISSSWPGIEVTIAYQEKTVQMKGISLLFLSAQPPPSDHGRLAATCGADRSPSHSVLTSKTSFQRGLRSSRTTWLRKLCPATLSLT